MNTLYEKNVKVNGENAKYAGQEGYLKVGVRYINLAEIAKVEQSTQSANKVFTVKVTFNNDSAEIFNFENPSAANELAKKIKKTVKEYKLYSETGKTL